MRPTIYGALGGDPGLLALAEAWHRRCLDDPVVSHAFSHPGQHPDHLTRLAAYWAETLGGPATYTGTLGDHSHVVRLHSGNGPHEEMDRRAIACFAAALDDIGLHAGEEQDERVPLRETLIDWFTEATEAIGRFPDSEDDVPAALPTPHRDWDGWHT